MKATWLRMVSEWATRAAGEVVTAMGGKGKADGPEAGNGSADPLKAKKIVPRPTDLVRGTGGFGFVRPLARDRVLAASASHPRRTAGPDRSGSCSAGRS